MKNVKRAAGGRRREKLVWLTEYGDVLDELFPRNTAGNTGNLIDRVYSLERRASRLAEQACSEPLPEGYEERASKRILEELDRLLMFRAEGIPVFLNGDPRGYALKVDEVWMRAHPEVRLERDWGGYGILAPEVSRG